MGGVPELRSGLATLPAQQPAAGLHEAAELVFDHRRLPTIPVLAAPGASLVSQACCWLDGVRELPTGRLEVDTGCSGVRAPGEGRSLAEGWSLTAHRPLVEDGAFDATRSVLDAWRSEPRADAAGLRVDMVGPVSLALGLIRAGLTREAAIDAARGAAVLNGSALLGACRASVAVPIVVVMVESQLFGSAHPTFPFSSREVRSLLDPVVDALDVAAGSDDVVIGVHVPGRADLATIISSGVSLLSTPLDASVTGWACCIRSLLGSGGYVAWGAVPLDRPLGPSAELLWRHLVATWRDLEAAGVDRELLVARSLVAPSDRLSCYATRQVPGVIALVDLLAERVAHEADRLRPSVLV